MTVKFCATKEFFLGLLLHIIGVCWSFYLRPRPSPGSYGFCRDSSVDCLDWMWKFRLHAFSINHSELSTRIWLLVRVTYLFAGEKAEMSEGQVVKMACGRWQDGKSCPMSHNAMCVWVTKYSPDRTVLRISLLGRWLCGLQLCLLFWCYLSKFICRLPHCQDSQLQPGYCYLLFISGHVDKSQNNPKKDIICSKTVCPKDGVAVSPICLNNLQNISRFVARQTSDCVQRFPDS